MSYLLVQRISYSYKFKKKKKKSDFICVRFLKALLLSADQWGLQQTKSELLNGNQRQR